MPIHAFQIPGKGKDRAQNLPKKMLKGPRLSILADAFQNTCPAPQFLRGFSQRKVKNSVGKKSGIRLFFSSCSLIVQN